MPSESVNRAGHAAGSHVYFLSCARTVTTAAAMPTASPAKVSSTLAPTLSPSQYPRPMPTTRQAAIETPSPSSSNGLGEGLLLTSSIYPRIGGWCRAKRRRCGRLCPSPPPSPPPPARDVEGPTLVAESAGAPTSRSSPAVEPVASAPVAVRLPRCRPDGRKMVTRAIARIAAANGSAPSQFG
jgi:hypothetical protein